MQRRPRVVYVTYVVPRLPSGGGITRSFHLIRALTTRADLALVVMTGEKQHDGEIGRLCTQVLHVPETSVRDSPEPTSRLRPLPSSDPFPGQVLDVSALRSALAQLLSTFQPEVLIVEHTRIAAALLDVADASQVTRIASLMDMVSVIAERAHAGSDLHPPTVSAGRQISLLRSIERRIGESYDAVLLPSDADRDTFRDIDSRARVHVVPNGTDIDYWAPVARAAGTTEPIIAFPGTLSYPPNIDAVHFMVTKIWPHVRAELPAAQFWAIGAEPPPDIRALDGFDGVRVFASVPDMRPYLREASVIAVPIRRGSGTRLKILEGLAAGRPIVSTTIGAEGLSLEPGRDYVQADAPEHFAIALTELLADSARRAALVASGLNAVQAYSWTAIEERYASLVLDELRSATTPPPPESGRSSI